MALAGLLPEKWRALSKAGRHARPAGNEGTASGHGLARLWSGVLRRLPLDGAAADRIARRAKRSGTSFTRELLASGEISEAAFFKAMAAETGIRFVDGIDPGSLVISPSDCLTLLRAGNGPRMVRSLDPQGRALIVMAPDDRDYARLLVYLRERPAMRERIRIVTVSAMRSALLARARELMQRRVRDTLFEALPYCSARIVLSGTQGVLVGGLGVLLVFGALVFTQTTMLMAHMAASVFFCACVALRLMALRNLVARRRPKLRDYEPAEMPRYTVLVALRHETEIIPELLAALDKLVWPRGKLEIKLICEQDDPETIAAIHAENPKPFVEVVVVPPGGPRTKPNALCYALQSATGDLVVLYDAEDRPHPLQLVEAWQCFERSEASLACVQAPLHIMNHARGIVAAMFAFEYSALFRGLLPWLSSQKLILPLGGTSNHFRRSVLDNIGAWDPYNVTEDADLGLRLCRFGYRTATIHYPTWETAPETGRVWLKQRTRWFKGWMQTWLVHMRHPVRLAQELGPVSFIIAQILFAGMIMSALLHPFLLLAALLLTIELAGGEGFGAVKSALLAMDLANVSLGYIAFVLLGRATMTGNEDRNLGKVVLFTPVYWMMMSLAAWRAAFQLCRDPFLWEKTPHPGGLMPADGAWTFNPAPETREPDG